MPDVVVGGRFTVEEQPPSVLPISQVVKNSACVVMRMGKDKFGGQKNWVFEKNINDNVYCKLFQPMETPY